MRSASSGTRRRAAFTLVELTVAMAIGMLVVGGVLYAYGGANRAQALAVGSVMLKQSGGSTLDQIYRKLNQSRHVFTRPAVAGTGADTFLAVLPIEGWDASATRLSPGAVITPSPEVLLPASQPTGSFLMRLDNGGGVPGGQELASDNPNFHADSVGNMLFFLSKEPRVTIRDVANNVQDVAFNQVDFNIHSYRFQLYYLARRQLPLNAPQVRAGCNYTYQLMHWDSLPYLEKRELEAWMKALVAANPGNVGGAQTFIDDRLAKVTAKYAGAIDLGQTTAASALFKLHTTDHVVLDTAVAGTRLISGHFSTAIKFQMKTSFGESFVAFNTVVPSTAPLYSPVPIPALKNANERVPTYAQPVDAPMGFEVLVAGPPSDQNVLLRLTLAARTQPGNVLIGESHQQLTHTYEY